MSDKTFKMTNFMMEQRIGELEKFLDRDDIIGYVAARNTRRLTEGCVEHVRKKNELVSKYGNVIKDENGNDTERITLNSSHPKYNEVLAKISESGNIEHDVTIFTLNFEDVKNKLTGREILQLDWMLDDN